MNKRSYKKLSQEGDNRMLTKNKTWKGLDRKAREFFNKISDMCLDFYNDNKDVVDDQFTAEAVFCRLWKKLKKLFEYQTFDYGEFKPASWELLGSIKKSSDNEKITTLKQIALSGFLGGYSEEDLPEEIVDRYSVVDWDYFYRYPAEYNKVMKLLPGEIREDFNDYWKDYVPIDEYPKEIAEMVGAEVYWSGGKWYLQLHDNHTMWEIDVGEDDLSGEELSRMYEFLVNNAIVDFKSETGVEVYLLGRSGRHVCVDYNLDNLIDYDRLKNTALGLEKEVINNINSYNK